MKLHRLNRTSVNNSSATVQRQIHPNFLKIWHYHPELELVYVLNSTGTKFIGNGIDKFEPEDIVLIGKNLPHMWINDDAYFEKNSNLIAEAISVHFEENFLGDHFFNTPEMSPILGLIDKARYGIKFFNVANNLKDKIKKLVHLNGFEKIITLLDILNCLAKHTDITLLSNEGYVNSFNTSQGKSLDKIYEYIFNNFNQPITLNTVADIAHMNASSFSRYFKRINRKTFSRYLNEIRIGFACKLLMEKKYTITRICYESGFNNISNFNRQFKLITEKSPTEYLKLHHNMDKIV